MGNVTSQYSVDVTVTDDVTEGDDGWEYMIMLFGEKNELDVRNKTADENKTATLVIVINFELFLSFYISCYWEKTYDTSGKFTSN